MEHRRPDPADHAPYYARYIANVPDDVMAALRSTETEQLLRSISEEKSRHRYAEGKWSIRQVVGHLIDGETVFGYRARAFAHGEQQEMPGFDENDYVANGGYDDVPLSKLVDAFVAARRSTILLFETIPPAAWDHVGVASGNRVSVRALAFILAGHERHHMKIVRERYLADGA
jgi:hypothetical protein